MYKVWEIKSDRITGQVISVSLDQEIGPLEYLKLVASHSLERIYREEENDLSLIVADDEQSAIRIAQSLNRVSQVRFKIWEVRCNQITGKAMSATLVREVDAREHARLRKCHFLERIDRESLNHDLILVVANDDESAMRNAENLNLVGS